MSSITLNTYNALWKIDFQKEKDDLLHLCIDNILKIEHIGSTAIPGLASKPIIDILIGVKNVNTVSTHDIEKIKSLGYRYIHVYEETLPFRRYFQKDNLKGARTAQIHLVNYPSQWYEKLILFRDYLQCNSAVRKEYESLKIDLAKQFNNTLDYADAKNSFCQEVTNKAFRDFHVNRLFLESERLCAFIPQLGCHDEYAHMLKDAEFCKAYGVTYTPEQALLRLQSDINHWNQHAFAPLMWYEKKTSTYIGRGGLKFFNRSDCNNIDVELTYQIKPQHWNKGFAEELGIISIYYAFKVLCLSNIICFTAFNNYPSLRVMQKLGFIFEGDFSHAGIVHKLHRLWKT